MAHFIAIFVIALAGMAGVDAIIWSQVNWSRNIDRIDCPVPLMLDDAIRVNSNQVLRWSIVALLLVVAEIARSSKFAPFVTVVSFFFMIAHLALSYVRYWSVFSSATHHEPR